MINLDEQQKKVVYTDVPKAIVAAGSGCGKTRCIIERIKFLLSNGYEAKNIYAITYTNAAAEEMKSRINNSADCFIGTIHSLANRILIQNGVDTNWMIQSENFDLLFEEFKKREGTVIFPQIDYLLIDEFQDICDNEYEFIFDTLRPSEYMVVGDSCQSIFGFKGSNFQYFMDLIDNPSITTFELNNNYRCGADIIDFAETFLWPIEDMYKVQSVCKSNLLGTVVKEEFSIDNLLYELTNYDYKDIFILTRSNKEIEEIKMILDKENIPNDTFKKSDLDLGSMQEILKKNSVKILTVHSAKGLEAKKVIVLGMKLWNNEERRIAYVAATRAQEELIWLTTKKKKILREKVINWE
jgi:superfamily I DNA/RNA helicase